MPSKLTDTSRQLRALVVDDEIDICRMLAMCLEADGHEVASVSTTAEAMAEASRRSFDVVFLDLRLGTENGLDAIQPLLSTSPWLRVVVITAYAAVDTAVEAMKRGAIDYLPKPFTPPQVRLIARKVADASALAQRAAALSDAIAASGPAVDFETSSAEMRAAVELARRAAEGSAAVLIGGEPGTGKRTLARAMHAWSPRAQRPIAIAASRAPSEAHLEAEWFGSIRKMPAGHAVEKPGRVAYCEGGTLLVEDVDELPMAVQPKLLRLIQDRQYERQADFAPRLADVRVIATTAVDLDALVARGEFRQDLLYALRTVAIDLPPLRRRTDDITLLAERFLSFFVNQLRRRGPVEFDPVALDALRQHSWPGNVRELRNLIERAVLVCQGQRIETPDFPRGMLNRVNAIALGDPVPLARVEELHIRGVLAGSPSIEAAAVALGMDTVTLWRRRKQYGI
jgi:NtrC-family two-component system response regulator AlgB